jgi:hypothetical protein
MPLKSNHDYDGGPTNSMGDYSVNLLVDLSSIDVFLFHFLYMNYYVASLLFNLLFII